MSIGEHSQAIHPSSYARSVVHIYFLGVSGTKRIEVTNRGTIFKP